ncbi:MAG: hypothetical protein MI724_16100 [Spirochaetales bacterium]|nr:hypothetical protein [Spirochaetales bacterium]
MSEDTQSEEVFILGAGFSKWLHGAMPVMTDLAAVIQGDAEISSRLEDSISAQ